MIRMQESIEFMDSNNSSPAFNRKWFELGGYLLSNVDRRPAGRRGGDCRAGTGIMSQ